MPSPLRAYVAWSGIGRRKKHISPILTHLTEHEIYCHDLPITVSQLVLETRLGLHLVRAHAVLYVYLDREGKLEYEAQAQMAVPRLLHALHCHCLVR